MELRKENHKFFICKKEDLDLVLNNNPLLKRFFETICNLIKLERISQNKKPVNYYVACNLDEPYAEKVWDLIIEGEKEKAK